MLSPKFYSARSWYSHSLAACVLLDPSATPTRDELPRECISDADLRTLLALVPRCLGKSELLVRIAWGVLPAEYMTTLARWLSEDKAFVWHANWYAARLRELELSEREWIAASRIAATKRNECNKQRAF